MEADCATGEMVTGETVKDAGDDIVLPRRLLRLVELVAEEGAAVAVHPTFDNAAVLPWASMEAAAVPTDPKTFSNAQRLKGRRLGWLTRTLTDCAPSYDRARPSLPSGLEVADNRTEEAVVVVARAPWIPSFQTVPKKACGPEDRPRRAVVAVALKNCRSFQRATPGAADRVEAVSADIGSCFDFPRVQCS